MQTFYETINHVKIVSNLDTTLVSRDTTLTYCSEIELSKLPQHKQAKVWGGVLRFPTSDF